MVLFSYLVVYNCFSCLGDHQDPEDQDGLRLEKQTAKIIH